VINSEQLTTQLTSWLDEQRKLLAGSSFLDELLFIAALEQLAVVIATRKEHLVEECLVSVSREYEFRLITLGAGCDSSSAG
jgi:hypothetical protein